MELQTYHSTTFGSTENAGPKKWRTSCDHMQQIQAWKMKDQNARAGKYKMKNAGMENVGPENKGLENKGPH